MTDGANYTPVIANGRVFHKFSPNSSVFGVTSDGYAFLGQADAALAERMPTEQWQPGDSAVRVPARDVSMHPSIHGLRNSTGVPHDREYTGEDAQRQIDLIRAGNWTFQHLVAGRGVLVEGGRVSCREDDCPSIPASATGTPFHMLVTARTAVAVTSDGRVMVRQSSSLT